MLQAREIEVFTAGCPICEETVAKIKTAACPDCNVVVNDLQIGCETMECREKAARYGVKSIPAVVIDGTLADCCNNRGPDIESLKQAGLGQSA